MNGRIPALILVAAAVTAGGGMWYAQEYGFYHSLDADQITLTVMRDGQDQPQALPLTQAQGIDSGSSPIRWRMCAHLDAPLPADAQPVTAPTPLVGPRWFSCFDAGQIDSDLKSGIATAYLSQPEIRPDVDRVIAVYNDGRVFGWHQINDKNPERGVMD